MSISFVVWRQLDLGEKDFDGEMVGKKILERIENVMAGEGRDPVNVDSVGVDFLSYCQASFSFF